MNRTVHIRTLAEAAELQVQVGKRLVTFPQMKRIAIQVMGNHAGRRCGKTSKMQRLAGLRRASGNTPMNLCLGSRITTRKPRRKTDSRTMRSLSAQRRHTTQHPMKVRGKSPLAARTTDLIRKRHIHRQEDVALGVEVSETPESRGLRFYRTRHN